MRSDQADEDVGRLLYAVENAVIQRWPYPHFLASGLLAADLIDELRALDLAGSISQLRAGRGTAINPNRFSLPLLPDGPDFGGGAAVDRLKRFFGSPDVMTALMRRFTDVIQRRVRTTDGSLLVGKTLDLIEDRTGYSLPPHADGRQKLLTLIVYLDDEPQGASLGTSLYTPKPVAAQALLDAEEEAQRAGQSPHRRRGDFTRVATAPHLANTALAFAPSMTSYHGVEPVAQPGARRFLLQYHVLASAGVLKVG